MSENGEPSTSTGSKSSRLPAVTSRLTFEFVVIFLGVWGALWAENRREDARNHENALRIAEAIVHTIDRGVLGWGENYLKDRQRDFAEWRDSYDRGDRPIPFHFTIPGAERGTPEMWEAALSARIVEVFDPVGAQNGENARRVR